MARRAGDPRLSAQGRELLTRMVSGDLVDQFQSELDEALAADPLFSGEDFGGTHEQ